MAYGLTFQINPEGETVSLDLFVRTLEDVRKLVIEVDYAVNHERSGKRWAITELHSSAPTFTIVPVEQTVRLGSGIEESIGAIVAGISAISDGADCPPQYFTEDVLQRLMKMGRHFRGEDKANSILVSTDGYEPTAITGNIGDRVDRILDSGHWGLGSLEGRLEAVNFHRSPNFTIWDRVSRTPVRCSLPDNQDWKERVKALLGKRVLVRGRVRYFSNGVPRSISQIQDILDNTPDPTLPRAEFGCIPDEEAADDPVQFLYSIRGLERD